MVNVLVDELPEAVEIDGREYPLNTDWRAAVRTLLAFEDPELTGLEKQLVLLENLYAERPDNLAEALRLALKFLNGGQEEGEDDGEPPLRLYSFSKDAGFIFAAFRQTHGIDLGTAELHWWEFLALFLDLGSETTFCSLVGLRKRIKTGRATKEELKAYRDMREVIDLPEADTRTLAEKEQEAEFLRLVEEGKKRRAAEKAKNQKQG